jgi:hypothetical protein
MSRIIPNNRCELLVNDFISLAKQHMLTVEGQAICTTTFSNGLTLPSVASWRGYTCEPEQPPGIVEDGPQVNSDFKGTGDLTAVEIEYYKEDVQQLYAIAYPPEIEAAPIYGGRKTINTANTANTSYVASSNDARAIAESYLGRNMSDEEWNNLMAAIFSEAGRNQTEEAYVAAAILNRVRIGFTPVGPKNTRFKFDTVTDILYQRLQFEAVTGSSINGFRPSSNFLKGPTRNVEISIYGALKNILPNVDKRIINFTSNNDCLYVNCDRSGNIIYQNGKPVRIVGRAYDYLLNLRKKGTVIGSSVFSF